MSRIMQALECPDDWAQLALDSIGDAVITTDRSGRVTYLNATAERLTGWACIEANGRWFQDVFNIVDADTRSVARNPMDRAVQENRIVALTLKLCADPP